jgi:periplasmic protein TonB
MQPNQILQAQLLDIVFENRNKSYGAYNLRKNYPVRLYKAFGLVFLIFALLSIWVLSASTSDIKDAIPDLVIRSYSIPVVETAKKKEQPKLPEKPKQQQPAKKANTALFVSRIKMVDHNERSNLPKNLDSSAISNITVEGPRHIFTVAHVDPIAPKGGTPANTTPTHNPEQPLAYAEVMPSFPGGVEALRTFLQNNLANPRDLENGEEISVKVAFVVGYDGKLKKFEVQQDGGKVFNEEVIRVLKKMPDWIPGKTKGENVSVYYAIPVKFVATE